MWFRGPFALTGALVKRVSGVALIGCLLSGCPRGLEVPAADAGQVTEPGRADAGPVNLPTTMDAAVAYPTQFAGEACPPEAWAAFDGGLDGGLHFGLCIVLQRLTLDATLNGAPVKGPVDLQLQGGGFGAQLAANPSLGGRLAVRAMRGRYDLFQYHPSGVFPTHDGLVDVGFLDLTGDQQRTLAATSHRLRGSALFGGLPFAPSTSPQDLALTAAGEPTAQRSAVTSQGGAYELSLLEGRFALFLSTPASALFGTELRSFQLNTTNLTFDRDQQLDVDLPTSLLEGELTIDGQPLRDRRAGPDFELDFVKPGDAAPSVITHHEGGLAQFTALVPKNPYGLQLSLQAQPDPHFPSQIANKPLTPYLDLTRDGRLVANLVTHGIEGAITIDGQPITRLPSATWRLALFGAANQVDVSSFLLYEVPQEGSAFELRVFPGTYLVVLELSDTLADDLAQGFWVVDRTYPVARDTTLPIAIETAFFTGRLTIDGQAPPQGQRVGWLTFRNRAAVGQYSWFRRPFIAGEDGYFRVRLPKGEYEVYFTIDNQTFPSYASGRELLLTRVVLDQTVYQALDYRTVTITGPLRVAREVVPDTLGGPAVGLVLHRESDLQDFTWTTRGGRQNFELRVPTGQYGLDFVINPGVWPDVAFGSAPLGVKMNLNSGGDPLALDSTR